MRPLLAAAEELTRRERPARGRVTESGR
jgi:hypothetical protein